MAQGLLLARKFPFRPFCHMTEALIMASSDDENTSSALPLFLERWRNGVHTPARSNTYIVRLPASSGAVKIHDQRWFKHLTRAPSRSSQAVHKFVDAQSTPPVVEIRRPAMHVVAICAMRKRMGNNAQFKLLANVARAREAQHCSAE